VSAEAYASLLERSGHRVVRTASAWWYEAHPHWFLSIPFHTELNPSAAELAEVFDGGAWVIRLSCPISIGTASYRSACDDPGYSLSTLSSTARRATRRGLESCTVRRLPFAELESRGGLGLSRSTFVRQHRKVPADHDQYWRRHFAAAGRSDTAECWGAFAGENLVAFLIAITIDDCVYLPVLKSSSEHLSEYPNNALVYSLTRDALSRPAITEVSWGLESLLPDLAGLERFKRGMGFEQRPIGQRIEMTRWLGAAVRGPATWAVPRLAARGGGHHTMDRAAATLRWHAQQPRRPVRGT
jgi:hypothetical protein